jgi:hypothetical protein
MNITEHTIQTATLTIDGETKTVSTQVLDRDCLLEEARAQTEEARKRLSVTDAKETAR